MLKVALGADLLQQMGHWRGDSQWVVEDGQVHLKLVLLPGWGNYLVEEQNSPPAIPEMGVRMAMENPTLVQVDMEVVEQVYGEFDRVHADPMGGQPIAKDPNFVLFVGADHLEMGERPLSWPQVHSEAVDLPGVSTTPMPSLMGCYQY